MTTVIAFIGAALGAASLILHVVAPKTKTKVDDKALDLIDRAKEKLGN